MSSRGKVLFMDDEEIIIDMTRDVLTFLGYEVTFAREGHSAIDLYKQQMASGNPFDIVILDLSVPSGLGGKETIAELKKLDPGVKAVVSSGYADDPAVRDFSRYGFLEKLTKPYGIQDLKTILERLTGKNTV